MPLPVAPLRHQYDAEILRLAVPALGALVAEPLFLLADSAIVGHLGTPELAGLGVAATILGTSLTLCLFLAYGTTAAVARMLGAGDQAGALRRGIDGLWLAVILGLVLAIAGVATSHTLVSWFQVSAEASGHAQTYLRISMAGLPSMLVVLASTGVLRGLQDTRTPLIVAVWANAANVGLNLVLVYGADMGIAGSALGTVLAQTAAAFAYLRVVVLGARRAGIKLLPDWQGVRQSFAASAPLVLRNLAIRAVVAIATVIAARLGSAEVAAHQVAFNVWITLALALDAVAIAGQALVGRYLGAGDVVSARAATRRMVELSVMVGFVLGLALLASRTLIAPLFSQDPEVREFLASALLVAALIQPLAGWVFALDGVLMGAGDVKYIALAQAATVAVFAPLAWAVVELDLGLSGLWWAIAAWVVARLLAMAWRERGDAWAVTGATRG
ncbi:MAG TPA: MATE family efflux transporter [Dehalococcoidia bacterium]|nr:MATE family efflux transporter [Dehalococcoidia bacterium]